MLKYLGAPVMAGRMTSAFITLEAEESYGYWIQMVRKIWQRRCCIDALFDDMCWRLADESRDFMTLYRE